MEYWPVHTVRSGPSTRHADHVHTAQTRVLSRCEAAWSVCEQSGAVVGCLHRVALVPFWKDKVVVTGGCATENAIVQF